MDDLDKEILNKKLEFNRLVTIRLGFIFLLLAFFSVLLRFIENSYTIPYSKLFEGNILIFSLIFLTSLLFYFIVPEDKIGENGLKDLKVKNDIFNIILYSSSVLFLFSTALLLLDLLYLSPLGFFEFVLPNIIGHFIMVSSVFLIVITIPFFLDAIEYKKFLIKFFTKWSIKKILIILVGFFPLLIILLVVFSSLTI